MKKPIVIYGPQASGKTGNADRFKRFYEVSAVVEVDFYEGLCSGKLQPDTIYLTNDLDAVKKRAPDGTRFINVSDALKEIGDT